MWISFVVFNFPCVSLCRPFNYLCKTPELVTLLQGLSASYDISPLLRYLLPHLVCTVMKSDTGKLAYIFTILLSLTDGCGQCCSCVILVTSAIKTVPMHVKTDQAFVPVLLFVFPVEEPILGIVISISL